MRWILTACLVLMVLSATSSSPASSKECQSVERSKAIQGKVHTWVVVSCGSPKSAARTAPQWRPLTDAEKDGTGFDLGFLEAICLYPYASLSAPNRIEYFGECESERGPSTSVLVSWSLQKDRKSVGVGRRE